MSPPYAINALLAELGPVPNVADPNQIRQFSRERFASGPALRRLMQERVADLILQPRDVEELARCVSLAARYRIPLTPRGAGTADSGSSVPLEGGIQLNLGGISGLIWQQPGVMRARAGMTLADIDRQIAPGGWELRLHPSTRAQATLGGFVAGGLGGIGSCSWGMLRDRGNILGLQVMSVEAEPRLIELRGRDIDLVHQACGTNAIITEVELPTAPAWEWREVAVGFPGFHAAAEFAVRLAHEDGIPRKLVSILEWPIPRLLRGFASLVPDGHSLVNAMVAAPFREGFEDLVAECGGVVVAEAAEGDGPWGAPLYEFSWGHVLHQLRRVEPNRTGVQAQFPPEDLLGSLLRVQARFGAPAPMAVELARSEGRLTAIGSPLPQHEGDGQVPALMMALQSEGAAVAVPPGAAMKRGGIRQFGARDRAFKQEMDPQGLLNPGRLSFDLAEDGGQRQGSGWSFRRAP